MKKICARLLDEPCRDHFDVRFHLDALDDVAVLADHDGTIDLGAAECLEAILIYDRTLAPAGRPQLRPRIRRIATHRSFRAQVVCIVCEHIVLGLSLGGGESETLTKGLGGALLALSGTLGE
jgi:hypothetical protein